MRKPTTHLIVAIAWICLGLTPGSHAQSTTFEQKYAEAKVNAATRAGRAYGRRLFAITKSRNQGSPDFLRACQLIEAKLSLHGYYEFTSASHYRVVLRPESHYADCITAALENRKSPPPPHIPYRVPFDIDFVD